MCQDEQQIQVHGHHHTSGTSQNVFGFFFISRQSYCKIRQKGGFVNEHSHYVSLAFSQTLLECAETEHGAKKYTFVDLFRTPNIRKLAIYSGMLW